MPKMLLKKGDALKKINNSEYVIEDEITIGGQDHFLAVTAKTSEEILATNVSFPLVVRSI